MGTTQRMRLCPTCDGRGVTEETAPEFARGFFNEDRDFIRDNNSLTTVKQGSGCPRCLGACLIS